MRDVALSLVALTVCVGGLSTQAQQSHVASASTKSQGQYQLVPVALDAGVGMGGGTTNELFLIDTQSGKVWRYQVGGVGKKPDGTREEIPELFWPVGIVEPPPGGFSLPTTPKSQLHPSQTPSDKP